MDRRTGTAVLAMMVLAGCFVEAEGVVEETEQALAGAPLLGAQTRAWGSADVNRCVPRVIEQLTHLRDHGDAMGFRMGAGYPEPYCEPTLFGGCLEHWQGVVRMPVGDGRTLAVSSSNIEEGSRVALVRMGSRAAGGQRLRGNRLNRTMPDDKVAPPTNDVIQQNLLVRSGVELNHPGGLAALGRYLFVPLEDIPTITCEPNPFVPGGQICVKHDRDTAAIVAYDLCDQQSLATCNPALAPREVWSKTVASGASYVAATKLADGRFLMMVARGGSLDFYVSYGNALSGPMPFTAAPFSRAMSSIGYAIPVAPYFQGTYSDEYQAATLFTECDTGKIFLAASHNTGADLLEGKDYIDLFEVTLTGSPGATSYGIDIVRVANRHVFCSPVSDQKQCDFDAGGGAYVDPAGRLLYYGTEHDNDGPAGTVKMMEFSPPDPVDDPDTATRESCTLDTAFVELFAGNLDGRSLFVDQVDRAKRNYRDLGIAGAFDETARSARWCLPPGLSFRLFTGKDMTGTSYDLTGADARAVTSATASSACFASGGRCLCDHSKCSTGPALLASCDPCVQQVCAADPFCCSTAGQWDFQCLDEVRTVCDSLSCPLSAPGCAHTLCTAGSNLAEGCDAPPNDESCSAAICAIDPYCCTTSWDGLCVSEVGSVCGKSCI